MSFYGLIIGISVLFSAIYITAISSMSVSLSQLSNSYAEIGYAASLESFASMYNNIGELNYITYSARLDNFAFSSGNGSATIGSNTGADYIILGADK